MRRGSTLYAVLLAVAAVAGGMAVPLVASGQDGPGDGGAGDGGAGDGGAGDWGAGDGGAGDGGAGDWGGSGEGGDGGACGGVGGGVPTTEATLSGTLGDDGWYRTAVVLNLKPSTESTTWYHDGAEPFVQYDCSSPPVFGNGTHSVTFYSRSDAGTEDPRTVTFKVDMTPPTFEFPAGGETASAPAGSPCHGSANLRVYRDASVTVTMVGPGELAHATSSGLREATFELVNGTASTGPRPAPVPTRFTFTEEGDYTLRLDATDVAGNRRVTTRCLVIDRTAPTIALDVAGPVADGLALVRVTSSEPLGPALDRAASVSASASSGSAAFTLTDAAPPLGRSVWGVVPLPGAGEWGLTATASDEAGNAASVGRVATVTPASDFDALRSVTASAAPGCTAFCDKVQTRVAAVVEQSGDGIDASALRLVTQQLLVGGRIAEGSRAPTAHRVDGAGAVHAWWNVTYPAGVLAYRVAVTQADGGVDAGAWRGVVVADATPPRVTHTVPSEGEVHAPGGFGVVSGRWGDASGVDPSSALIRLYRAEAGGGLQALALNEFRLDEAGFAFTLDENLGVGDYVFEIIVRDTLGNLLVVPRISFSVAEHSGGSSGGGGSGGASSDSSGDDCVGGASGSGASGASCDKPPSGSDGGGVVDRSPASSDATAADETPPTLDAKAPVGRITVPTPEISASFSDDVGVVPESVVLELDGVRLPVRATATGVSHTPEAPLSAGPHVVRLRADDESGKSLRAEWTFVVVPPRIPGESVHAIVDIARVGTPVRVDLNESSLLIESAEFTVRTTVSNLTLSAARLASLPPLVVGPPGEPLSVLDVSSRSDAEQESFEKIVLRFLVPRSVLAASDALPAQVLALHFTGGAWTVLNGTVEEEGADAVRYAFEAHDLSPFALVADTRHPSVTPLAPLDTAILAQMPGLRASLSDDVGVATAVVLVDNAIVASVTSPPALVSVPLADVADGRHSVEVRATDVAGNTGSRAWTFILDRVGPTFPRASPEGVVSAVRPTVEMAFADSVSGIDLDTVSVRFDGEDVTEDATVTDFGVTFNPPHVLDAGRHELSVTVADRAGNLASHTHAFEVETGRSVPFDSALGVAAVAVAVVLSASAPFSPRRRRQSGSGNGSPKAFR